MKFQLPTPLLIEMHHSVLDKHEYADSESEAHFAPSPHNFTSFKLQIAKLLKFRQKSVDGQQIQVLFALASMGFCIRSTYKEALSKLGGAWNQHREVKYY